LGTETEKYMKGFGVQGAQLQGQIGTLQAAGGLSVNQGTAQMEKIVKTISGGGITGQMSMVINAIGEKMTSAVEEGVNNSELANDLADEITKVGQFNRAGMSNSAIKAVMSTVGVQQAVGRGEWGNVTGNVMMQTGMEVALSELKKGKSSAMVGKFMQQGFLDEETLGKFQKTGGIDSVMLEMLSRQLNTEGNAQVRAAGIEKILGYATGGERGALGQAKGVKGLLDYTKELGLTPESATEMVQVYMNKKMKPEEREQSYYKIISEAQKKNQERAEGKPLDELAKRYAPAGDAISIQNQRASLLFTDAAAQAANSVKTIDTAMIGLAASLSGVVAPSMEAFNKALIKLVGAMEKDKNNE